MLNAIVFDFDGVVVDSEPLHCRAFLKVAGSYGVDFNYVQYLKELVGFDDRDGFQYIFEKWATQPAPIALEALIEEKKHAFEALVREGVQAIPGTLELIDEAHGKIPIAIASGATKADIDLILNALQREHCFEIIVTADDVAHSKPDPATYQKAVEAIGIAPEHCLAIEDTAAGLTSAQQAGLQTLALTTTTNAQALQQADRVVEHLKEINLETLRQWYA